jgi:hypothetical protein
LKNGSRSREILLLRNEIGAQFPEIDEKNRIFLFSAAILKIF